MNFFPEDTGEHPRRSGVTLIFAPVPGPAPIVKPVPDSELHKWYMLISNGITHSGGFAYHLQKQ